MKKLTLSKIGHYGPVIAWVTAVASALQRVLLREKERPQAKTWVRETEQTEPGIKPMMKQLLFHYQGCGAAHGWRSRDLWQEVCLGNLHGLLCRRGKESLMTRRRGIWVSIQRWCRKVDGSRIFSYSVPSLCFTTNHDCMTVPADWTKQTWNTYLPVSIAWTEEMWCTHSASHQRGQEFCAEALRKSEENMVRRKWSGKAQNASNY